MIKLKNIILEDKIRIPLKDWGEKWKELYVELFPQKHKLEQDEINKIMSLPVDDILNIMEKLYKELANTKKWAWGRAWVTREYYYRINGVKSDEDIKNHLKNNVTELVGQLYYDEFLTKEFDKRYEIK